VSLAKSATQKINYEIAQIEKEFDIITLLTKKLYSSVDRYCQTPFSFGLMEGESFNKDDSL
jgi:hypothetical protein